MCHRGFGDPPPERVASPGSNWRKTTMATLLISHPACLLHLTPPGHPERPDRLRAVERELADQRFKPLIREEAPDATFETIMFVQPLDYMTALRHATPQQGFV